MPVKSRLIVGSVFTCGEGSAISKLRGNRLKNEWERRRRLFEGVAPRPSYNRRGPLCWPDSMPTDDACKASLFVHTVVILASSLFHFPMQDLFHWHTAISRCLGSPARRTANPKDGFINRRVNEFRGLEQAHAIPFTASPLTQRPQTTFEDLSEALLICA